MKLKLSCTLSTEGGERQWRNMGFKLIFLSFFSFFLHWCKIIIKSHFKVMCVKPRGPNRHVWWKALASAATRCLQFGEAGHWELTGERLHFLLDFSDSLLELLFLSQGLNKLPQRSLGVKAALHLQGEHDGWREGGRERCFANFSRFKCEIFCDFEQQRKQVVIF